MIAAATSANEQAVQFAHWIRRELVVLLAGIFATAVALGQSPAPPAAPGTNRTAEEKRACIKNLKTIYDAIQAYQVDQHDVPNWLSDLVPKYLADPNVLVCPVCRRTGETESPPLADPKLPSSYLFEFCPLPLGNLLTNAPTRTRRDWKRRQMGLVGSQVPIVRCRHHKPVLNLAFDGRVYESPASWELLFTNRVNLGDLSITRLFADVRPAALTTKKKASKGPRFTARSKDARKELLDLTRFYTTALSEPLNGNKSDNLRGLSPGVQEILGVDFDVRGVVQLRSASGNPTNLPAAVKAIPVRQQCQRLHFLHAATMGDQAADGQVIGSYVVRFAGNQSPVNIPIRYGHEVRNCHALPGESKASADLVIAWRGKDSATPRTNPVPRLFLTTWTNIAPELDVESLDFVSEGAAASPFLVAITAD